MAPEKFLVATDVVLFGIEATEVYVLLIQRKNPPFKNVWALPGGFLNKGEDLKEGALRELAEETGIKLNEIIQIGAYGKPNRDPRSRVISIAFVQTIQKNSQKPVASDDAKTVAWHSLGNLPELAFDHNQIIADARTIAKPVCLHPS